MTKGKQSKFTQSIRRKGWTAKEAGERWGIKQRAMTNTCANPKQKDWDALNGLPEKEK